MQGKTKFKNILKSVKADSHSTRVIFTEGSHQCFCPQVHGVAWADGQFLLSEGARKGCADSRAVTQTQCRG